MIPVLTVLARQGLPQLSKHHDSVLPWQLRPFPSAFSSYFSSFDASKAKIATLPPLLDELAPATSHRSSL